MSEIITPGRAWATERKGWVVQTTRPDIPNLSDDVLVIWKDTRAMSSEQRRKAWALMTEIADYQGQSKEETYGEQQAAFSLKHLEILQDGLFHLSQATMSEARAFINMLIETVLENGIPTKEPLYGLCDDLERYSYACLLAKKCAVCGRKTELHHVDQVGMGRNRREISHLGMMCLPLCREHHEEAHMIGKTAFLDKYHLQPIPIDQRIADKYHLKTNEGGQHE